MPTDKPQTESAQTSKIQTKSVTFPNGRQAKILQTPSDTKAQLLWEALAIPDTAALILLSSNAEKLEPNIGLKLQQLFSRGLIRAAKQSHALILDSATDAGAVSIIGRSLSDQNNEVALVGMVAASDSNYLDHPENLEANHSHFVLLDDDKARTKLQMMFGLVSWLKQRLSAVTLLVNGDEDNKAEILRSVRLGLPVIMLTGSGGLADILSELQQNPPEFIEDPLLAEIIADGDLHPYNIKGSVSELERLILRQLRGDATLMLAWKQFAVYDANAERQQKDFRRLQGAVLYLGVLATLLVVMQSRLDNYQKSMDNQALTQQVQQLKQETAGETLVQSVSDKISALTEDAINSITPTPPVSWLQQLGIDIAQFWHKLLIFLLNMDIVAGLKYVIILIPIIISILLAAANRFNAGSKWLILRSSAEGIKREIFRYRAQAEVYSAAQSRKLSREVRLAKKLQAIGSQLSQTEVNLSAFRPYTGVLPPPNSAAHKDDGLTSLNPERYLLFRLQDQLNYYVGKTSQLEGRFRKLQWGIYIIGGLGTLFAALNFELWIALTTSIVTALGTYLEYQQMEKTLTQYNQAAIDLTNVRSWWVSLSAAEQAQQSNINLLVGQTERVLQSEFSGWVQDMQDALNNLKEQQSEDDHLSKTSKENKT